jgi:hypothetical protein
MCAGMCQRRVCVLVCVRWMVSRLVCVRKMVCMCQEDGMYVSGRWYVCWYVPEDGMCAGMCQADGMHAGGVCQEDGMYAGMCQKVGM